MFAPPDATQHALRECAEFLAACLTYGWRKDDLDNLEELWWQFHDRERDLRRAGERLAKLLAECPPPHDAKCHRCHVERALAAWRRATGRGRG